MVWITTFFACVLAVGIIFNIRSGAEGVHRGRLAECPNKPNCVCSQDVDPQHTIEPLIVKNLNPIEKIQSVIQAMPRTKIVKQTPLYLHAIFRSKVFQFIDDVEFLYIPEEEVVHIRSASRLGYRDFGVNRERMENIRKKLLNDI